MHAVMEGAINHCGLLNYRKLYCLIGLIAKLFCELFFPGFCFFSGLEAGSFPNVISISKIISGKCLQESYFVDESFSQEVQIS